MLVVESIWQGEQPKQSPEEQSQKDEQQGLRAVRSKWPGHGSLGATGRTLSCKTFRGLGGRGHGPGAQTWVRVRRGQWSGEGATRAGRSGLWTCWLDGWVPHVRPAVPRTQGSTFISCGCGSKYHKPGGFKQQKSIFSQFWRLEV